MSDEAELAKRASQGEVDAFCLLVDSHQRKMYRLAFRFCGNHHDAEDLAQEVFLSAFRAIGGFRGAASFETWLRRIMVNSFLNHKRKAREHVTMDAYEGIRGTGMGSETAAVNSVLVGQVLERLNEIPPRQRLMFLMKHQEGLTAEEIAEHFGTSVGTVKKTVFRVVDQLRREFRSPGAAGLAEEPHNA